MYMGPASPRRPKALSRQTVPPPPASSWDIAEDRGRLASIPKYRTSSHTLLDLTIHHKEGSLSTGQIIVPPHLQTH